MSEHAAGSRVKRRRSQHLPTSWCRAGCLVDGARGAVPSPRAAAIVSVTGERCVLDLQCGLRISLQRPRERRRMQQTRSAPPVSALAVLRNEWGIGNKKKLRPVAQKFQILESTYFSILRLPQPGQTHPLVRCLATMVRVDGDRCSSYEGAGSRLPALAGARVRVALILAEGTSRAATLCRSLRCRRAASSPLSANSMDMTSPLNCAAAAPCRLNASAVFSTPR